MWAAFGLVSADASIELGMSSGNGHGELPVEVLQTQFPAATQPYVVARPRPRRRPVWLALVLFALTIVSTLAVGAQFQQAFASNVAPFSAEFNPSATVAAAFLQPRLLLLGIPFSFTLLAILLAHELGHFFACRYYGIDASYPYFIPAPTIVGTMGAFIRIRSPILNRRALFDVGLAGPVVGFLVALPALLLGILHSKVVPGADARAWLVFGNPPLVKMLMTLLYPGLRPENLLLNPIGRAAWVGLFATALNLIPAGQLDGGHILYSVASEKHRQVSLVVVAVLFSLSIPALLRTAGLAGIPAVFDHVWPGWLFWAVLLLLVGFRHPPLLDRWEPLDAGRRAWALVGLVIFVLSFTPVPFATS